jgi:hypothetical protein
MPGPRMPWWAAGRFFRQSQRGHRRRVAQRAASGECSERLALGGRESHRDGFPPEEPIGAAVVALVAVFDGGDLVAVREHDALGRGVQAGVCARGIPHIRALVPLFIATFAEQTSLHEHAVDAELFPRFRADGEDPGVEVGGVDRRAFRQVQKALLLGAVAPQRRAWFVRPRFGRVAPRHPGRPCARGGSARRTRQRRRLQARSRRR